MASIKIEEMGQKKICVHCIRFYTYYIMHMEVVYLILLVDVE